MADTDRSLENLTPEEHDKLRDAAARDEARLKAANGSIKDIEVMGYKFTVDTDLLDDVDTLEIIERIENKGQVAAVLPLLKLILGEAEYQKMKTAYTEIDAKQHAEELKAAGKPEDPNYKARFRANVLSEVYLAIIDKFDPKG